MVAKMYELDKDIPTVRAFPTDTKIRVVWAYGALIRNCNGESNIPKVEVLLREISSKNELKDIPLIIKIEFTEIDIVRQGTIWHGRNRLNEIWKGYKDYKENMEFQFDFTSNHPSYIKFLDKNSKNNNYYIPKQKYNFGNIQGNYGHKYHFANSIYTKLITNTGTTILIHGLEFLTSTYVPQEKSIRGKLLNKPIDNILDEYIEEDSYVEDNIYHMHFKENKRLANNVFLSYAKYNQTTRIRLSRLRASLESDSKFQDRYPIVLPYHPEKMRMIVDGIWLDSETFLVFRIKGCSLPKENVLRIKKIKEELIDKEIVNKIESENESENSDEGKKDDDEKQNESHPIDPSEVDIDSGNRPHKRNPSLQIVSEVIILDEDDVEVSYTEEIKQKNHQIYKTEYIKPEKETDDLEDPNKSEKNEVDKVSSGEPSQSEKDKNTTSFEVFSNIAKSEMLVLVEEALKDMKNKKDTIDNNEKIYINNLFYLNESCLKSDIDKRPKFYSFINSDRRTEKSWSIIKSDKGEKGYRRFMLIKIELSNEQYAYLLEIDRRSTSESYSGFIFNYVNQELSELLLGSLIKVIVKNKGKYSKRDIDAHKMVDLVYPIDIQKIYGHQTIKKSMYKKIKRVIKEAYNEGLFM